MKNLFKNKWFLALGAIAAIVGIPAFGLAAVIKGLSVASIIPSTLTFSDDEVRSLNECIYEKVFVKPSITQFHDIETGIKAGKQIAFLGRLGLIGKLKQSCDTTPDGNTVSFSEKFWAPKYIGGRDEQCWSDLLETFFIWGLKNGYQKHDLTGTEFAMFYEERLGDALSEAIHRIVWFGKTDAANTSDGGNITSGTDTAYFTPIDGLWEQVFDAVTLDSTRKISDLASKNGQASYSAQQFNSTDTTNKVATLCLQNLKFAADMRLRGDASGFIICTQSVMDQYERERSAQNLESGIQILENGLRSVRVGGVPVYAFDFWDRYIQNYYDDGSKYYLPHRALYVTKSNIRVGTEEVANFSEFNPFYSQDDKVYRCDFGFNVDAKLMESYMFQAAY